MRDEPECVTRGGMHEESVQSASANEATSRGSLPARQKPHLFCAALEAECSQASLVKVWNVVENVIEELELVTKFHKLKFLFRECKKTLLIMQV